MTILNRLKLNGKWEIIIYDILEAEKWLIALIFDIAQVYLRTYYFQAIQNPEYQFYWG